jgi:hypothetical protein
LDSNSCLGTGISANNTTCPCKGGYHVPNQSQWQSAINDKGTNLPVILKLPMAGYPNISSVLIGRGTTGIYWSSSPS